jgi:hypothetical protein
VEPRAAAISTMFLNVVFVILPLLSTHAILAQAGIYAQ